MVRNTRAEPPLLAPNGAALMTTPAPSSGLTLNWPYRVSLSGQSPALLNGFWPVSRLLVRPMPDADWSAPGSCS